MTRAEALKRIRAEIRPGRDPGVTRCNVCDSNFLETVEQHYNQHAASRGWAFWAQHCGFLGLKLIPRARGRHVYLPPLEGWIARHSRRAARVGWVSRRPHYFMDRSVWDYLFDLTRLLQPAEAEALLDQMLEAAENDPDAHAR